MVNRPAYWGAMINGHVDLNGKATTSELPYRLLANNQLVPNPLYAGTDMTFSNQYYSQAGNSQSMYPYGQQQFGYGYNQSPYPTNQQPMFNQNYNGAYNQYGGYNPYSGNSAYAYATNYTAQNTATTTTQGAPTAPVERTYGDIPEGLYKEVLIARDKVPSLVEANIERLKLRDMDGDNDIDEKDVKAMLDESKGKKKLLFFKSRETKDLEDLQSKIEAGQAEVLRKEAALEKADPGKLKLMDERTERIKGNKLQGDNAQANLLAYVDHIKDANDPNLSATDRATHWAEAMRIAKSAGSDGLSKDGFKNLALNAADLDADTSLSPAEKQRLLKAKTPEALATAASEIYAAKANVTAYKGTSTGTSTSTTLFADQTVNESLLKNLTAALDNASFDANGDGKVTNAEVTAKLKETDILAKVANNTNLQALLDANNFKRADGQSYAVASATSQTVLAQNVGTSQTTTQGAGIV